MVKQGPCCHCGVTSTPLWRNGPVEKPVLCNACGSRWRTKGSLTNYAPLHLRAEPAEIMDYRVQRIRAMSRKHKEAKVLKRKQNHDVEVAARVAPDLGLHKGARDALDYNHRYFKSLAEDISNRSSSGSAVSNSESYVQLGRADANDLTGAAQSIVRDIMVPSKKRTCVGRPKPSSVEKLTKDLYAILQEQQTYRSGSTDEDLLLECNTPTVSVEIGHGSVLIRHPSSIAREEDSEASSLSVSNKPYPANEACSQFTTLCNDTYNKFDNFSSAEIKGKRLLGQEKEQELNKRKMGQQEKLEILENHKSPICSIELKDVLNFEEFGKHVTNYELQELLKLLPSVDTVGLPYSLRTMFNSLQFKESVSTFQKLLADGVFDLSLSDVNGECNRILKRLLLSNLKKSSWVEQYNLLKDTSCKSSINGPSIARGNAAVPSAQSPDIQRSCDGQLQNLPGSKKAVKTNYDNQGTCFSPKILLEAPGDSTSLMLDCFQFAAENSDHDLLLNIPSHSSFPQAELLLPNSGFGAQVSTSSN